MAQRYKRKLSNFFINKNFQGKIILAVFLAAILSCVAFILIFGLMSSNSLTISYSNNDLQMGQTPLMLLKNALIANWIFIVICGTLIVLATVIGSHRIAGPIFRLEKALDSMNKRNLDDTIHLRGKDEGKELAEKINNFNKVLSSDLTNMKRHISALNDLLNHYEALGIDTTSEDTASIYRSIRINTNRLKDIVASYRLLNE